jgi:hypothetical protein
MRVCGKTRRIQKMANASRPFFHILKRVNGVEWHLKRAWAPLLFADEHLAEHRADRDPVAQAEPAEELCRKKATRHNEEGYPLHSFRTLLAELGTQSRNTCQFGDGDSVIQIRKITDPSPLQLEAFRLLQQEL